MQSFQSTMCACVYKENLFLAMACCQKLHMTHISYITKSRTKKLLFSYIYILTCAYRYYIQFGIIKYVIRICLKQS